MSRTKSLRGLVAWSLVWLMLSSLMAEVFSIYSWQPFTHPNETARLTSSWTDFRDCEVLLVGSSLAELGLSSPTIGAVLKDKIGRRPCVFNLAQQGLSAESAVSYLGAVLEISTPRILLWATSPQACMTKNGGGFLEAYASPYDILRGFLSISSAVSQVNGKKINPDFWSQLKSLVFALFRPPALLFQATFFAGSESLGYLFDLPPTRFQRELAELRLNAGWMPMTTRRLGSKAKWKGEIEWRSIDALRKLVLQKGVDLGILLMPIDEKEVTKEAVIRKQFTVSLAEYCHRHDIPYVDLLNPNYRLDSTDFMVDGRHLIVKGAQKLSREVALNLLVPMLATPVKNSKDQFD